MDWTCTFPGPRNTTPSLFAMVCCLLLSPAQDAIDHPKRVAFRERTKSDIQKNLQVRWSRPTHDLEMGGVLRSTLCVERVTAKDRLPKPKRPWLTILH